METMEQKYERNCRVQASYDQLIREGKHGHYETMFRIVREEVERERERWAAICRGVMAEHGGDPAGQLVDYGNRDRLVAQFQAAGASQVLIRGLGA